MAYMHNENGRIMPDICEYIAVKDNRKPQFVYFGEVGSVSVEEAFKKLLNNAKYSYKALMAFLFDSGIRCPTELMNVKRKDVTPINGKPFYWLTIRDETSKTFGRKLKLMLCHELLRQHFSEHNFKADDFLFQINPIVVNRYLKRLGERVLGKRGITMYDFRHNSACYWLPRYNSESALMYRFGWKDSKMIHYYTELMGMKDTIQEEDMLIDVTKTELQKELDEEKKERELLQEQISAQKDEIVKVQAVIAQSASRDELILKMIKNLVRKGKMQDIIEAVKEEGLAKELAMLK